MAAFITAMSLAAPLGLKALAVIAGKALVISKVALTIAGIIVLKKLYTSEHHEETNFEVKEHNRRTAYMNSDMYGQKAKVILPPTVVDGAAAVQAGAHPFRYYYNYPAAQPAY